MKDKLCVSERRSQILDYLISKKQTTRSELSEEFHVSTDTIDRDIVFLSSIAPISTKQGNRGGVYIFPDYKRNRCYLTDEEESCLNGIMDRITTTEKKIVCGIITRFSKRNVI